MPAFQLASPLLELLIQITVHDFGLIDGPKSS
jgi:hypothetical protein